VENFAPHFGQENLSPFLNHELLSRVLEESIVSGDGKTHIDISLKSGRS